MLDTDLATFFDVSTKRLNEQVKRNQDRFPEDFRFRLTDKEYVDLKKEFPALVSSYGGRRYLPYAFTEHGTTMLATVINTSAAIQTSLNIVRAFVDSREQTASSKDVSYRLGALEAQCTQIFNLLKSSSVEPKIRVASQEEIPLHAAKQIENLKEIQIAVARYYKVLLKDLSGQSRKKPIVAARQVAIYLIRVRTKLGLREIGSHFGERDHSTVLHAIQKVSIAVQNSPKKAEEIKSIYEHRLICSQEQIKGDNMLLRSEEDGRT